MVTLLHPTVDVEQKIFYEIHFVALVEQSYGLSIDREIQVKLVPNRALSGIITFSIVLIKIIDGLRSALCRNKSLNQGLEDAQQVFLVVFIRAVDGQVHQALQQCAVVFEEELAGLLGLDHFDQHLLGAECRLRVFFRLVRQLTDHVVDDVLVLLLQKPSQLGCLLLFRRFEICLLVLLVTSVLLDPLAFFLIVLALWRGGSDGHLHHLNE